MVAASLLVFIWNFARLLSRHGRQQREFLAGMHVVGAFHTVCELWWSLPRIQRRPHLMHRQRSDVRAMLGPDKHAAEQERRWRPIARAVPSAALRSVDK